VKDLKFTRLLCGLILLLATWRGADVLAQAQLPSIDGQIADSEYAHRYWAEAIGMELHWTIEGEYIYIGLRGPTLGWVSVGWNPTGAIKEGADIIIGYLRGGELFLQDYFANTSISHLNDVSLGGRDDVLESSGSEVAGAQPQTTIEFRRRLETNDKFDRPIAPGAQTVLLAYSPYDDFVSYHGEKRTVVTINFFAGGAQEAGLFARPRALGSDQLLQSWLWTVLTGIAMIVGLSVAYLLWPGKKT
jgi:hypothetical protein